MTNEESSFSESSSSSLTTTTSSEFSQISSSFSTSNNSSLLHNETFIIGLSSGVGGFLFLLFVALLLSLIAYKLYQKCKQKTKKPSSSSQQHEHLLTASSSSLRRKTITSGLCCGGSSDEDGHSVYEANQQIQEEDEDAVSSSTTAAAAVGMFSSDDLIPKPHLTALSSSLKNTTLNINMTMTCHQVETHTFSSTLVEEEGVVTSGHYEDLCPNSTPTSCSTAILGKTLTEEYGVSSPLMSGGGSYQQEPHTPHKKSSLHNNYDSISPRSTFVSGSGGIAMPSFVLRNLRNEEQVIASQTDATTTNSMYSSPRISIVTRYERTNNNIMASSNGASVTFMNDDGDEYEIESDVAITLQQQGYGELNLNDPIHLKRNEFLQFLIHQHLPKFLMSTSTSTNETSSSEDTFKIPLSDAEDFMSDHEFSNEHVIFKDNFPVPTEAVTPANLGIDTVKGVSLKGILKVMENNEIVKKEIFDLYEQLFPTLESFIKFLISQKDQEIRNQFLKYLLENYICDLDRYSMYKSLHSYIDLSNSLEMETLQRILFEKATRVTDWSYPNAFSTWDEFLRTFDGAFTVEPNNEHTISETTKSTNLSYKERPFNISKCIGPIRPPLVLFFNHPKVIAEHLTVMDALLFRNVNTHKDLTMERYTCLNGQSAPLHKHESSRYSATSCPSLSLYIEFFNKLGIFTKFCIFYKDLTIDQRATCIERLIIICEHLERLGNYNSLMAIYSALTSQPVCRMKNVWDKVSESSQNYIRHLEYIFMIRKKFENLRRAQFTRQPPIIPYFGIFMTEMTQVESIHNTYLDSLFPTHVNMAKLHQIYKIHQQIETCQLHAREYLTHIPLNTNLFNQLHDEIIGFDIFRLELVISTPRDGKTPARSMSIDSTSSTGTDGALTPRLTVFTESNGHSAVITNETSSLLTVPTYEDSSPQTTPRGGKRKNLAEVADKEFSTQSLLINPKSRSNSNNATSFFGGLLERLSPKRLSFPMSPTSNSHHQNNLDASFTAGNTLIVSPRAKKFCDSEPTLSPRMRDIRNLADCIK